MESPQILEQLNNSKGFPTEAVLAARADKDAMIPVFIKAFEDFVSSGRTPHANALFLAFHLLGEWRAKSAYRTLAGFLRIRHDILDEILGDAITVTAHRVMAAVFDGDPQPLLDIIYDEAADEFIRSRMIDTIAMLAMRGDLSRDWLKQFLRDCYDRLQPQQDCFVWHGWQQAIAWAGFVDLKPLVEQAFARKSIDTTWLSFEDFAGDLQHTIDHPGAEPLFRDNLTSFNDTIEELSTWDGFKPKSQAKKTKKKKPFPGGSLSFHDPQRNPFEKVGRNDPCPCGSGKKFKKCCLNVGLAG